MTDRAIRARDHRTPANMSLHHSRCVLGAALALDLVGARELADIVADDWLVENTAKTGASLEHGDGCAERASQRGCALAVGVLHQLHARAFVRDDDLLVVVVDRLSVERLLDLDVLLDGLGFGAALAGLVVGRRDERGHFDGRVNARPKVGCRHFREFAKAQAAVPRWHAQHCAEELGVLALRPRREQLGAAFVEGARDVGDDLGHVDARAELEARKTASEQKSERVAARVGDLESLKEDVPVLLRAHLGEALELVFRRAADGSAEKADGAGALDAGEVLEVSGDSIVMSRY